MTLEQLGGGGFDYLQDSAPSNPSIGETWLDTSQDPPISKVYADLGSGGQWTTDLLDSPISEAGGYNFVQSDEPSETPLGAIWGKIGLFSYQGNQWSHSLHSSTVVWDVATDGSTVISGGADNTVYAVDISDGAEQWSHSLHSDDVNGVATDGSTVISGGDDNTVYSALARAIKEYVSDGSNWVVNQ
jgi:WD40 repeat protein